MSESVLGHLDLNQIGRFSFNFTIGSESLLDVNTNEYKSFAYNTWNFFGHIKDSPNLKMVNGGFLIGGNEVDTTHFFEFKCYIKSDLIRTIYPKSSDTFRKKHIKILKSSDWINGSEWDLIDMAITNLEPYRIYDMDRIVPIIRNNKISNIIK
jgi:hypothetical protein